MTIHLQSIDIVIMVAYLGAIWSIGLYIAYRRRKHDEGFLVDRRFGWFNIGSSIFATNIGPSFLVGAAGAAYAAGMATASFEWLACIFLFLLAVVFAPHYLRMRISTIPEFMRRRFGTQTADFLACYGLVSIMTAWVGADMYVGSKVLNQILGVPDWQCLVVLTVIFTSFTVAGGFAAVMVTDTFQAVLMIASMLTLNFIAFGHVGWFHGLIHGVPADAFHGPLHGVPADCWQLFRPAGDAKYPWPAIVFGYPILGIAFWCADQTIVQRMLGARDLKQAQFGAIYTGFLKILPPFLFMMPGIFCLVLRPYLENPDLVKNPDHVFLTMLATFMPHGMTGLMIAVLGAASVAGVAGGLNAFTTIFTMDIYRRNFRPDASQHHLKRVSQLVVVVTAIVAMGAALLMLRSGKNVFDTLQNVIASFSPPVAVLFLSGIGWRRATAAGSRATLYVGALVSLGFGILELLQWPRINPQDFWPHYLPMSVYNFIWPHLATVHDFWPHYMMMAVFKFLFCAALMVVVSLCTQHAPYEEDFGDARRLDPAPVGGAGATGWILWGILAIIMLSLYAGFQFLARGYQPF
jgi:SSS family solute:Na+ symporter